MIPSLRVTGPDGERTVRPTAGAVMAWERLSQDLPPGSATTWRMLTTLLYVTDLRKSPATLEEVEAWAIGQGFDPVEVAEPPDPTRPGP